MKQQKSKHLFRTLSVIIIMSLVLTTQAFPPQRPAYAATTLSVTPITWNVIGLDSNNVNVGPNHFPIGARVCNTGATASSTLTANFVWDNTPSPNYIDIRPGTLSTLSAPGLAAGACTDFYFEVEVARNSLAYNTTRSYHIAVTADGGATTGSTPIPRELFIEHLISQSRNDVSDIQLSSTGLDGPYLSVDPGGTMTLMVGNTYWIKLVGFTATNGYEQIESFINFPNTIFQVLAADTTYTVESSANMSPPYDRLYGDACTWENNPNSPNYRSCLSTGKAGGDITVTYQVKILSVPSTNPEPLTSLIYDFSGSSYHYNADFGVSTRFANIVNASIKKSFAPKTITPGGTSTLTFTISNPGPDVIAGVNFADSLPAGMTVASTPNVTFSGCGTGAFSPTPSGGSTSLSFSGGSVAGYGTCTITVNVTASTVGTYNNTSGNLFIITNVDTHSFAQDSLVVSTKSAPPSTCTNPSIIATWTMPTSGQGSGGPPPPYTTKASDVSSATASSSGGTPSIPTIGNPANSWEIAGGWNTIGTLPNSASSPYFQFALDTSNYGGVAISLTVDLETSGDWTSENNNIVHFYSQADSGSFSAGTSTTIQKNKWEPARFSAPSTGLVSTTFRINIGGGEKPAAYALIDNVTITGCPTPVPPTLSKVFSPVTIAQGSTSTLSFTITNPNATPNNYALSGISFNDTLPAGLSIVDSTGSVCGGTNNLTTAAATRTISLTGGSLAAGGSCTLNVNVTGTTAGKYKNISDVVSATQTGPNTTSTGFGTADLNVIAPPIISKLFAPNPILPGSISTLTFTIRNPNPNDTLNSVAFADTYPTGLTNTNPAVTSTTCTGGTVTATNGGSSVSLSGAMLSGAASCIVTTKVTANPATPPAIYPNTSGAVSHLINSIRVYGNTASDTLMVNAVNPKIAIKKQVGTSASGLWYDSLIIPANHEVYYNFIVENTGDVALNPVSITDDKVNMTNCNTTLAAAGALPAAVAANENHIRTCVVGPLTAAAGSVKNTAHATGTYSDALHNSNDDTATYQNGNFGHLPSAYTNMNMYNDGGAFMLNGSTYLGTSVTTNATDGINTATYTPKATDDGVTWTGNWNAGTGYATVNVTCPSGTCYLYAWFDWNGDKDFTDANEAYNWTVTGGNNNISFSYPGGGNLAAGTYYTRFRLYAQQPSNQQPYGIAQTAAGTAIVGEIEDPFITSTGGGGTPTPVTVSYFRAQRQGSSVNFDWSTSTETGNVGFNIYVEDGDQLTLVNTELIPSKVTDSLERQDYSFTADVAGNTFYIEDVSVLGEARRHGPFQLGEEYGNRLEEDKIDQTAIQQEHTGKQTGRQDKLKQNMKIPAAALEAATGGEPGMQLANTLNLKVRQTGIYRVSYEMLRDAGLDLAGVPIAKIALTNQGQAVPVYVDGKGKFGPGGFIEFYGQALDTIYTDTNIYTLQVSRTPAIRVQANSALPGNGLKPPASYLETLVVNNQKAYANYAPGVDAWYDTSMLVYKTSKSWSFPFQVIGLADPAAPANLELVVWGVTPWPQSPDHHLVVILNGITVADQTFDGLVEQILKISLPSGVLQEGANTLQLTLPGDTGVKYDMVNLDKFSLSYQRLFQAQDGRLTFSAAGKAFVVTNLPSKNVVVYRMSEAGVERLERVNVQAAGSTFTASFAGTNQSATYLVSAVERLYTPALEAVRLPANLNTPAQYLIISHPDFISGLEPLVQARQAQGLTVSVVDVNDLYTQYSYGIFDPQAIKQYIAYAAKNLGTQYVLLVGGDTYDYRNYLGRNSLSFIPSIYATTGPTVKFVPADPLYTDLNNDNLPDLAIGRFPVRTSAELVLMVNKTLAYAGKNYGRSAVYTSDKYDGSISFKNISTGLAAGLPASWSVENIHLDDMSVTAAQSKLLAAMNRGTALVTFTGHSGPATWTFSNLFTTKEAAALTNAERPFVVVQWGCWNTYYVDPVNNYLVQSFLFSGDRGAAAVLGAATLTDSNSERLLGELLSPRLVAPGMTMGQALQTAKSELALTHPELLDVLLGWSLMGDPALIIEP